MLQRAEGALSDSDNVIHVAFGQGGGRIIPQRALSPGPEPARSSPERDDPLADLYSASEVAKLFAVSASRLRYWDRTGFLSPSGKRGRRRCYTFQDLIGLRAAKALLDGGVPLQRVRRSVDSLRGLLPKVTRPLNELRVVADGQAVVVRDGQGPFDASTGQGLLDFGVSELRDDVVRVLKRHGELDADKKTAYDLYLEGCRLDEDDATFSRAEEMYQKALELDPALANALTNLGNVRFRRGFPEEAEVFYRRALAIDADQPEAYYNLGFLYYERGDAAAAVPCFERAVESDPAFADAHFNLAMALEEVSERARAKRHWQIYLQLEPQGAWAEVAKRHLKK
jgi:tetratricopeptide (TPR) repeat protein